MVSITFFKTKTPKRIQLQLLFSSRNKIIFKILNELVCVKRNIFQHYGFLHQEVYIYLVKKYIYIKPKDLEFSDWILSKVEVHSLYINSSDKMWWDNKTFFMIQTELS